MLLDCMPDSAMGWLFLVMAIGWTILLRVGALEGVRLGWFDTKSPAPPINPLILRWTLNGLAVIFPTVIATLWVTGGGWEYRRSMNSRRVERHSSALAQRSRSSFCWFSAWPAISGRPHAAIAAPLKGFARPAAAKRTLLLLDRFGLAK